MGRQGEQPPEAPPYKGPRRKSTTTGGDDGEVGGPLLGPPSPMVGALLGGGLQDEYDVSETLISCEGPPPLKFSAPALTEGAPGPLLWEAPYSCGNPAVERISGILRYYNAAPRGSGGPPRGGALTTGAPLLVSPSGSLEGHPSADSDMDHTTRRRSSDSTAGDPEACPSLPVVAEGPHQGPPPSSGIPQGAAASPSGVPTHQGAPPSSGGPPTEGSTVVLVAPRIPTYVPPAAFCGLLLNSNYPFLQAKVLQGPSPSEYLMVLEGERATALEALQALNGVFFGGPLGAFCELRLVCDVSLKVQTRKGAPGGPFGGPCPIDPRTEAPRLPPRSTKRGPPDAGVPRAAGAPAPSPIGSVRGPPVGGPSVLGGRRPTAAAPPLKPGSVGGASAAGDGRGGAPLTPGGGAPSEEFLSPLHLLPRYDSLHFCAVCLDRLSVVRPPPLHPPAAPSAAAPAAAGGPSPQPPAPTATTTAAAADAAAAATPSSAAMLPAGTGTEGPRDPQGGPWQGRPEGSPGDSQATAAATTTAAAAGVSWGTSPKVSPSLSFLPSTPLSSGGAPSGAPGGPFGSPAALGSPLAGGPPSGGGPPEGAFPGSGWDMPIAVLCGHSFHVSCLQKWRDASCPVCRYQQHPLQPSCCSACGETEGIMICLVCGFTGCGGAQKQQPHPLTHQPETGSPGGTEIQNNGNGGAEQGGPQGAPIGFKAGHALLHFLEMSHSHALEVDDFDKLHLSLLAFF